LPSAWVLASWANSGRFDGAFYALQSVELIAGAINITLLTLNMRDGLRLSGRLGLKGQASASPR
jgi:cytoskeletal protein CcmA (bactofilin family)